MHSSIAEGGLPNSKHERRIERKRNHNSGIGRNSLSSFGHLSEVYTKSEHRGRLHTTVILSWQQRHHLQKENGRLKEKYHYTCKPPGPTKTDTGIRRIFRTSILRAKQASKTENWCVLIENGENSDGCGPILVKIR